MCLFSVFDNGSSAWDLLSVNAHASNLYFVDQRRRVFIYRKQLLDDAVSYKQDGDKRTANGGTEIALVFLGPSHN